MSFFPPPASAILEGNFTSYSLIATAVPLAGTIINDFDFYVDNGGNIFLIDLNSGIVYIIDATGNVATFTGNNDTNGSVTPLQIISATGRYRITWPAVGNNIIIYKDKSKLTTVPIDTTTVFEATIHVYISISPNAQYIVIYGINKAGTQTIVQIWQGS